MCFNISLSVCQKYADFGLYLFRAFLFFIADHLLLVNHKLSLHSPNLFNIFVNDLTNCLDETCMPVLLGEHRINCLLYADDLIILSESASGLQNCLNVVGNFALHGVSIIIIINQKSWFSVNQVNFLISLLP